MPISDRGGGDHHRDAQPERIEQQVGVLPYAFLVAVEANCRAWCGRLDALALRTARRRCRQSPLTLAFPSGAACPYSGSRARLTANDGRTHRPSATLAKVRGQQEPLPACRVDRENALAPASERLWLSARAARSPWRIADLSGRVRQGTHRRYPFPGPCVEGRV